jgi:tRNA-Thr(GGU) m(6)t(6)A37 methyltransferase TsaA
MNKICFRPIGIVRSPFKQAKGTPIQPSASVDTAGTIELLPEYSEGLQDLEGFSHIILLYYFHKAKEPQMKVRPFMDDREHGIFAQRAPSRPNPIGLSIVRLDKIKNNILFIRDVDLLDGTPLLDIKPYVPEFDIRQVTRTGWLEKNVRKLEKTKDDERFAEPS